MSASQHSTVHTPTTGKTVFHLSLLLDLQLVEGKLIDLPTIETFPVVSERSEITEQFYRDWNHSRTDRRNGRNTGILLYSEQISI